MAAASNSTVEIVEADQPQYEFYRSLNIDEQFYAMAVEVSWSQKRDMSITAFESAEEERDAVLQARRDGITAERIEYIRSRCRFFWSQEMQQKSKKVADEFEAELGAIIKKHKRGIRGHTIDFFVKGAMNGAYKMARRGGMYKRHGKTVCDKLAHKYHLHSGGALLAAIKIDTIAAMVMALDF